jgi:hypothetical protein
MPFFEFWDVSGGAFNTNSVHHLSKQFFDCAKRKEEPPFDSRKFEESVFSVKRDSTSVFGIHDDARRSDFPGVLKNAIERVHEQCLTMSLAAEGRTYRQASKKGCRHHRIFRQFLRNLGRHVGKLHGILRKRVVTGDRAAVRRQNKGNRRMFLEILSRLLAEVSVQKFNTARESRSIVFRTERLNDKLGFFLLASQLTPHPFFVAFRGGTSGFVGRRRIQEGIHKHIARFVV